MQMDVLQLSTGFPPASPFVSVKMGGRGGGDCIKWFPL